MKYLEESSKAVIAKVYRDLNLQEEERWHDMIEWVGEALDFIGANPQYRDAIDEICIQDHRGALPCNLHAIDFVMDKSSKIKLRYASDQRQPHYRVLRTEDNTTSVPNSEAKTYTLNGNYINTEARDATIILSYKAFPVDEEGFPMVPKEVSVKTALFWYIVKQLLMGGYVNPNISMQYAEEQWNWYCGQSRGKLNMPNLDQMEQIRKTMMRMIPQINLSEGYFVNQNTTDTLYE
jgi:hypothetical protein